MKTNSISRSAFFYLRSLLGLLLVLAGGCLALLGFSQFSADAQEQSKSSSSVNPALIPAMFDCSQLHALGYHIQENLRAGAS